LPLLSRCSIKHKLLLGVALLFLIVATLSLSGMWGISSYRQLVRMVSQRAAERPLADKLTRRVAELRDSASKIRPWREKTEDTVYNPVAIWDKFHVNLLEVKDALSQYRAKLDLAGPDGSGIGDARDEWEAVRKIQRTLERIESVEAEWVIEQAQLGSLVTDLDELHELASGLPQYLQDRMQDLKGNVRGQYHTLIALTWTTSILSAVMLAVLVKLFYDEVFRPLGVLIRGSRRVAGGDFQHRIQLSSHDEMAELAAAMNAMTSRFQEIRDDLDRQVKLRTKEVVRSEQLASVGFLAAGVAHEINNPLASIAWSAESLETRLHSILYDETPSPDEERDRELDVLRRYLRRIQDEAFRCKGITEKLLDFSRIGDVERQDADLRELTQDVIEMIKHLGRYRNKHIEFTCRDQVVARVNAQEIKQVILNLLANALDSLDPEGVVQVEVRKAGGRAMLVVRDNGCGMTEEVQEHLFEPFFTRRRDGQGTGLGLSITFRIIVDHGGTIEAHSDGPGKGSTFQVTLPLIQSEEAHEKHSQAT
jgi:two-component system, NtrC family, sensor kinase